MDKKEAELPRRDLGVKEPLTRDEIYDELMPKADPPEPAPPEAAIDGLAASAGAWADLLDCEAFERDVHERRHRPRPPVDLDPTEEE